MTNTRALFERAKLFQDKRAKMTEELENRLERLKGYEGSKAAAEREKLQKNYDEELEVLQREAGASIDTIIRGMERELGKRKTIAPTREQLDTLSILRMRNHISDDELRDAAELMRGCPIALESLEELAKEAAERDAAKRAKDTGQPANPIVRVNFREYKDVLGSSEILNYIQGIKAAMSDFIKSDTTRASRVGAEYNRRFYGVDSPTKRRPLFETSEQFWGEVLRLEGREFSQFAAAVDGDLEQ